MKENLQGSSAALSSLGGGRMTQAPQKNMMMGQAPIGGEESPAKIGDHIDNKFTADFQAEYEQNLKTPT